MSAVSVIGLGAMGGALARALLRGGHTLTVWNRSSEKARPFVANGVTAAASIGEAVTSSSVTLICVDSYTTTRSLLGAEDVVACLSGRTLIQLGTGTPREAKWLADWCDDQNVTYIDGAIECLPSVVGTEGAQLLFAGPKHAYRNIDQILKCLGGDRRYLGENVRAPAALDLAWLSQRLGQMIGALHGICLCESEGVDIEVFEKTFPKGDQVQILASRIKDEDYLDADATVAVWDAVSCRFEEQARDAGINSEFPNFARKIIQRAIHVSYGGEDVAALIKALRG